MSPRTRTDEELMQAIDALDLEPIKVKLMDEKEGEGWTLEQADAVEKWYKRFLFLSGKYPSQPLVPTPEIDVFWHQHILDTRKYQEDCDVIFGWFLHHFPYLGMRGEDDARKLIDSATATWALYEKHFSESVQELTIAFKPEVETASCSTRPPTCACSTCGNDVIMSNAHIRPVPERSIPVNSQAWH
jgi:hypothetical protein